VWKRGRKSLSVSSFPLLVCACIEFAREGERVDKSEEEEEGREGGMERSVQGTKNVE